MKTKTLHDCSGSILMVAVVLAGIMAVTVGSFIKLAQSQAQLSNISFQRNNSLNLAEGGIEKGLYALNYDEWTGWIESEEGDAIWMPKLELDLGKNQVGTIQVHIQNYRTQPVIIAEGRSILNNRPDVVKQLEVRLTRRSLFANGITSRRGTRFSGGNVWVGSYQSTKGPPSATNMNDNGSVASASVETNAIDVSNSTIYGYVATGGSMPTVGDNGRIYGKYTDPGVKIDLDRVTLDFASDFPEVDLPAGYDFFITGIDSTRTLGTPGAVNPIVYQVGSINLAGHEQLMIVGPVVLHVTGDVDVTGNASIHVASNGSLVLYGDNKIRIAGNGAVNANTAPANLLIYGSNSSAQEVRVTGNGNLKAVIYAPNAAVEIFGNGEVAGAVVGDTVRMNGNANFYYDEDLADFGPDKSYRMDRWREYRVAADYFVFNK